MVVDLRSVLVRICDFLEMKNICTEERIKCVLDNSKGTYKRKSSKSSFDPYTKPMRKMINRQIQLIKGKLLKVLGLKAPWEMRQK